jgi:hypothetical protein
MKKSMSIVAASMALAFCAWVPQAYALCEGCGMVMSIQDAKAPAPVSSTAGDKKMAGDKMAGDKMAGDKMAGGKQKVVVKMDDGKTRTVTLAEPTKFKVGDKVKVVGNGLAPQ